MFTKLIVFDIAGTLVKENSLVYKCLSNAISQEIGRTVTYKDVCGYSKTEIIKKLVPDSKRWYDTSYQFKHNLLNEYEKSNDIHLIDGVDNLFEHLKRKNIFIGIGTGFDMELATTLLKKVDLNEEMFDYLVTSDQVCQGRPAPDMINLVRNRCNANSAHDIKKYEVMKVGDTILDLCEGYNAGAITCGVLSGEGTQKELEKYKPDYIFNSVKDLKDNFNFRSFY